MAKNILSGNVTTSDNITFTVNSVAKSERDIIIVFDSETKYKVVKLDVNDLPADDGKKTITWINNFGIMDSSGNYVSSVTYTVFLPAQANASFIYKDAGGLKTNKTPTAKGKKPERSGMVQVEFDTGDPGVGWK